MGKMAMKFDPKEDRTKQSEADACDINRIMARFEKTGRLPIREGVPTYGDFSNIPSLQGAFEIADQAVKLYHTLPLSIRKKCDYDPVETMRYVNDPANSEEMAELGLLKPKKVDQPKEEEKVKEKANGQA